MFQVDENYPIPECRSPNSTGENGRAKYPFRKMKVGDSFAVPKADSEKTQKSASNFKSRTPGWDYVTRVMPDSQLRVWRTA